MGQTKTIHTDDINFDTEIKHPVLPDGFIKRVMAFMDILAEVHTHSLEVTVHNFQKDTHPERELEIWEAIAKVYQVYTTQHPSLSLEAKQDVYTIALGITMGKATFDNINELTAKQAQEVANLFNKIQ